MTRSPDAATIAPHRGELALAATYERTVHASLARIWENVLDWEHLPWLHRTSFCGIDLLGERRDGWRAVVRMPPASTPREAEIDVELDRSRLCYLTRTLGGFGAGTEIATRLSPVEAHATRVTVEFRVPETDPALMSAIGAAYVRSYTRLWDEDESMMARRQAVLDTPDLRRVGAGAPAETEVLGTVDDVRARLPLAVEWDGRHFTVVELDRVLIAYTSTCPHLGGPLGDAPLDGSRVVCPWHGYRFDVRTGANLDGRSCRLESPPTVIVDDDGTVRLQTSRAG